MKMEMTSVQKLARVLKILVTIAFVCNLLALLVVPVMVFDQYDPLFGGNASFLDKVQQLLKIFAYDFDDGLGNLFAIYFGIWTRPYTGTLNVFLLVCGICTAIILWQARRVLDTILAGMTFSMYNADNMKRAGICCLIIAVAALGRLIWGFCYYKSIAPLLTYNALFIPIFIMGFLLCMVMSALFRQAAELKEENDLTI